MFVRAMVGDRGLRAVVIVSLLLIAVAASAQSLEAIAYAPSAVAVGDADNDGQQELLVAYAHGWASPHLLIWKYDGSYKPVWGADFPFDEAGDMSVDVGDMNGDGQNEVVVMNALPSDANPNGRIRIYKNTGGNNYDLLWCDTLTEGFRRISVGNIDADGAAEIVIGNSFYDRTLYYYDYQGGNNWAKVEIEAVGQDCHGLQVADADNDGQNEIVAGLGVWEDYSVRIYKYQSGSVQMIWSYSFCSVSPYGPGYWVRVGDIDNDSQNELLVTEESDSQEGNDNDVFVFEHAGGANWTLAWQTGFPWPDNIGARCPYIGRIQNASGNQFCFLSQDTLYVYGWNGSTYVRAASQYIMNRSQGQPWPTIGAIAGGDCDNDGNHETVIPFGSTCLVWDGFPLGLAEDSKPHSFVRVGSSFSPLQNPVAGQARIRFYLHDGGNAQVNIVDVKGALVRTLTRYCNAGPTEMPWDGLTDDGRVAPAGVYFYGLSLNGHVLDGQKVVKLY